MTLRISGLRRLLVGKEVGIIFTVLVAGSALITGFVPPYLAVLLASSIRNVHLAWLGSGILFYTVAACFLYLEAVALTALYLGLQTVYQKYRNLRADERSA